MRTPFTFLVGLLVWGSVGATTVRALGWTPGWTEHPAAGGRAVSAAEFDQARQLGDAIATPETARAAIRAWETIAAAQPDDPAAWIELGSLHLLEGAAFRHRAKDRLKCYIAGLQACERAMATNPDFLNRIRQGQTVWAAAAALGPHEMGAMHFWATGVFYIFRDCLGLFGRIINVRLMDRAKIMLERMDAIDPQWEESTSTFSWGIYYLAMPSSRGGDMARARACFDRAVALGEHRTLPRWGRGKYFYVAVREPAAARADLSAVAGRALDGLGGNRSWNRYFQAEALRMLGE
jgi:hypothetical protein